MKKLTFAAVLCFGVILADSGLAQQRRARGPFRLAGIEVRDAKVFPPERLIAEFPIKPGDPIDFNKVRMGLERIRRMYDEKGYVNFSYKPVQTMDHNAMTVSLLFELYEDRPYVINRLSFAGRRANDKALRAAVSRHLQKGKPFQYSQLDAAIEEINRLASFGLITRQDCRVELEGIIEGRDGSANVIFTIR